MTAKRRAVSAAERTADPWRNRIVGQGDEAPDQLLANPSNWRVHPKAQREALAAVLDDVGWVQRVIVNRTTQHVVDGHLRVALALSRDEPTIPVNYVELDEREEALVLAALDPIAAMATTDKDKLRELLEQAQVTDDQLRAAISDAAGLPAQPTEGRTDPDAVPDERATKIERGDLFALGDHRLLCGDCTEADDVARVMDNTKAEMMFTDPPYGVDYDGGLIHGRRVNYAHKRKKLQNDQNVDVWIACIPVVVRVVDGPCYMWFGESKSKDIYIALDENHCDIHAQIIWHKTNATYAALNRQYKQRHEPCLYFKPKGSTLRWCGPTTESTVWNQDRDAVNDLHPTQKPVALPAKAIANHDATTVLDLFAGSGSTLIAAEQLSRRCYAIEIEPSYCQVIIDRWEAFTGEKAKKVQP